MNNKSIKLQRRKIKIRTKVSGTAERPRLVVTRSLKHISCQIVDDESGKVLAAASDKEIKVQGKRVDVASEVGKLIASKAKNTKVNKVTFDRSGRKYHGRIKALADGARAGGLDF